MRWLGQRRNTSQTTQWKPEQPLVVYDQFLLDTKQIGNGSVSAVRGDGRIRNYVQAVAITISQSIFSSTVSLLKCGVTVSILEGHDYRQRSVNNAVNIFTKRNPATKLRVQSHPKPSCPGACCLQKTNATVENAMHSITISCITKPPQDFGATHTK
jgi:hypothetical protein